MALTALYLTGFEHGVASINGTGVFSDLITPAFSAPAARNGSLGFRSSCAVAGQSYVTVPFTAANPLVARFAMRVNSRPANDISLGFWGLPGGSFFLHTWLTAAGVLWLNGAGINVVGPTMTDTNWHVIEIQVDCTTTTNTADWKVDGVAQPRWTKTGATAGTMAAYTLGQQSTSNSGGSVDFDDLIIGSWTVAATDWWGDGRVLAQLPGSDGTHATITSLSPGDAGTAYSGTVTTAWTMVRDAAGTGGWTTTRSTTDNLALRVATAGAYAEIAPAAATVSGVSANAVRAVLSYSSSTTAANLAACDVRNSAGTVTQLWGATGGTGQAYNIVANQFKGGMVTKPAAGWTAAEVNAVRFRFGGCTLVDVVPIPTAQAMMLEVDWPAVSAPLLASQHHRRPGAAMQRRSVASTRGQF